MKTLLDASVNAETLNRIRDEILLFPPVKEIRSLQARNSGRFVFVRTELIFGIKKFSQAHQLSEEIEKAILRRIPEVDKVTIHYEPVKKEYLIYAIPTAEDRRTLSEHFGDAPYFFLIQVNTEDNTLREERILPNPYLKEEKAKGIRVSEWLLKNGVDTVLTKKALDGKGPFYVFSSSDSDVVVTQAKRIEEIYEDLRKMAIDKPR
jgi:predicted Fe-Mo cluster-binding NifX family protein